MVSVQAGAGVVRPYGALVRFQGREVGRANSVSNANRTLLKTRQRVVRVADGLKHERIEVGQLDADRILFPVVWIAFERYSLSGLNGIYNEGAAGYNRFRIRVDS